MKRRGAQDGGKVTRACSSNQLAIAPPTLHSCLWKSRLLTTANEILVAISEFLDASELLTLSSSCRYLYHIMDAALWDRVLRTQLKVSPTRIKPSTNKRLLVATCVRKNTCYQCQKYMPRGCKTLRRCPPQYNDWKLCQRCLRLPQFVPDSNSCRRRADYSCLTPERLLTPQPCQAISPEYCCCVDYKKQIHGLLALLNRSDATSPTSGSASNASLFSDSEDF
ncbi:hypothetical protein ACHHYP_04261 [Achlya hypogyna]|uniref:F-box domain-containing protein n=1 Tax=Achlya hypogyna TaxID=1202772 RepID=A0A1V9Z1P0_ACHHY|nr:hypothetical protein ACHHYP_04261 [Achlya hypogyna]